MNITVEKTITAPDGWGSDLWQQAIGFWRSRGFVFPDTSHGDQIVARRGSFWGNLTSYDMGKLRATLPLTKLCATEVQFVMEIDTRLQTISEWNEAYWHLEMAAVESWLLRGDSLEEDWRELRKFSDEEAAQWHATGIPRTRRRPPHRYRSD